MVAPGRVPDLLRERGIPPALGLLAAFVLVSVVTRWLSLGVEILDMDEAAHAVGSWVVLDGGRLYTDFVDNKPPLLYAYYALAQSVLGRGLVPVHLFTAVVTVPLTALAASAAFHHDRRGVAAGLLGLLYGAAYLAHDMLAANAELVLMLPASWAFAIVAEERRATRWVPLLAAGLLLGLATLVKHQAAFWLPALGWAALRARPASGRAGAAARVTALVAGFAIPLVGTWVGFAATGGAEDLLYWVVWRNVLYAANPISAGGALRRAGAYLLPWLLASAPLWWAWRRSRPEHDAHHRRLVDGAVVLGFLPAFAGFRFFPHYFVPTLFALSLGAAPAVAAWWEGPPTRAGRAFSAATAFLVVGFTCANGWLYLGRSSPYREKDPVYRAVALVLEADRCFAGSRLFVWGWAPAFYYEAGLSGERPASRFAVMAQAGLTSYVPGNPDGARRLRPGEPVPSPAHWAALMGDLERTHATYILDTAPAGIYRWNRYPLADYPLLDRYVVENYERIADVSGVQVYRRQGCVSQGGPASSGQAHSRRSPP